MKEKFKGIGLGLAISLGSFILAFFLIFLFLDIFYHFKLLSATVLLGTAFGCGVVVAVLCSWYLIVRLKATKSTRFSIWLLQNYPKLILFYIILNIIFISIRVGGAWSLDSLKDAISLEWTIFGISVAVFLVWNTIVFVHLEKEKPKQPEVMNSIHKLEYITQKELFYPQANSMFNSISLLILNVLALVVATASVYIVKGEVNLFHQIIVIVSFYLCTNTLIALLVDILTPLIKQKRAILKETKFTAEEIKEKEEIYEKLVNAYRLIQDIEKLESVDEEQKLKMKLEILFKADVIENCLEEQNDSTDSE